MGRRPGFGSVERLSSGRFRARYPGPDGRRYTAPTTFVTKSEARGWLSLAHAEITRKRWAPPESALPAVVTFGAYAQEWLACRDLRPRTREHYRKLLDNHLIPAFGPTALTSITAESIRSGMPVSATGHRRCERTATACCAPSWALPSPTASWSRTRSTSGALGAPSASRASAR